MKKFESVASTRLYRLIAQQIKDKINAGDFAVGERLPSERDLAEQFEVSRSSIREALIALEIEGLVEVRVGSGVFVASQSGHQPIEMLARAEIAESTEVNSNDLSPFELLRTRILLETESAALAAVHATDEQQEHIREMCALMDSQANSVQADYSFHRAIAAASGNEALAAAVEYLWQLSLRNIIFARFDDHFVDRGVWRLAKQEHEQIVVAIKERQPEKAREAMRHHLEQIYQRLVIDMQAQ